jgi:hypothetical protein
LTSPFGVIAQMWLALFLESLQKDCEKLHHMTWYTVLCGITTMNLLLYGLNL